MDRFLDVAREAADQAGKLLLSNLDGIREVGYKSAGHNNPVSQMDKAAEKIILDTIGQAFPQHGFISEEKGVKEAASDYNWIIDPLDGTVNFIHRLRYFCVSIALACRGEVVLGVIYNPILDEMFTAVKGSGTHLNGSRIEVSRTSSLDKGLLAISFPYSRKSEAFRRSIRHFANLASDGQAVRRDGSTALALCNVACGRYDGFCVAGNELWDYAAGIILVTEAGGRVTDLNGDTLAIAPGNGEVLATNGRIHGEMMACLAAEREI